MVSLSRPVALAGLFLVALAFMLDQRRNLRHVGWLDRSVAGGFPLLFGLAWISGPMVPQFGVEPAWWHWAGGIVWISLALILMIGGEHLSRSIRGAMVLTGLATAAVLGAVLITEAHQVGIDVTELHFVAADALRAGSNPYGEAVSVPDGAPEAPPGSRITGYPYPPATLLPFAVGTWLGDPRITSLVSWICVLTIVGLRATSAAFSVRSLGSFLTLASLPGWPLITITGWTEPLTLALLLLGLLWWRKPFLSSIGIGVSLATKQYMVILAPVLLLWNVVNRWRRLRWIVLAAAATFVPFVLWGVDSSTYRALIGFHLSTAPRPDGTSLVGIADMFGLSGHVPWWLAVSVPLAFGVLLGGRVVSRSHFAVAITATLTTAFLLGTQAFANYWLIPAGVMSFQAAGERNGDELIGRPQ